MIEFLHYASIAFVIALTSLGSGFAGGAVSKAAVAGINTAPHTHSPISRACIIGLALIETSSIFALVIAFVLLGRSLTEPHALFISIAQWGSCLALGVCGLLVSLLSALPIIQAITSITRQPFFSTKIINVMLINASIIQTPAIFAFLLGLLINTQATSIATIEGAVQLLSAGLALALGCIGPTIGLGKFAAQSCKSIGINRTAYNKILPFTFISQAIIETPIIFAFLGSLMIVSTTIHTLDATLSIITLLASALCIGIGTFGPGIASSKTAVTACEQIAFNPDLAKPISRTSLIVQALIDTGAIYALLVSLLLILL